MLDVAMKNWIVGRYTLGLDVTHEEEGAFLSLRFDAHLYMNPGAISHVWNSKTAKHRDGTLLSLRRIPINNTARWFLLGDSMYSRATLQFLIPNDSSCSVVE